MIDYHIVGADFSDPYKNHQIVKSIFQGDGKVLFSEINDKLVVRTNMPISLNDKLSISKNTVPKKSTNNFRVKLSLHRRSKGKRIPVVYDRFGIDNYVHAKFQDCGFSVLIQNISNTMNMEVIRKGEKFRTDYIEVVGMLEVNNQEKFNRTLLCGIGRDKMLGLGMLFVW